MYDIQLTKQAQKDSVNIERAGLKSKVVEILQTVRNNPYEESQNFEKLKGGLKGAYSRRITLQHRFVYEILPNTEGQENADGKTYEGIVKIISLWTHYE